MHTPKLVCGGYKNGKCWCWYVYCLLLPEKLKSWGSVHVGKFLTRVCDASLRYFLKEIRGETLRHASTL